MNGDKNFEGFWKPGLLVLLSLLSGVIADRNCHQNWVINLPNWLRLAIMVIAFLMLVTFPFWIVRLLAASR